MNPNNPYNFPPRRVVFTITQNPAKAGDSENFSQTVMAALAEFDIAFKTNDNFPIPGSEYRDARGQIVEVGDAEGDFLAKNGVLVAWKAWSYEDTWQWRLRRKYLRLKQKLQKRFK